MIEKKLDLMFQNVGCELVYNNMFELLIAVILSAQTTDKAVNVVTKRLFDYYPTPKEMAKAKDIEEIIHELGLYHNKAKAIKKTSKILCDLYKGIVPSNRKDLMGLPGVGRKTANVVLAEGFNIPALPVDTHVWRVSKRLRLVEENDNVLETEKKLMKYFPEDKWHKIHHQLLHLGRYICIARNPKCEECLFKDYCKK